MKPGLLIVDDDEDIRSQLKWALAEKYEVHLADDRVEALDQFNRHKPLVVLLDLGLPPNPAEPDEGMAVLEKLLDVEPLAKVLIVSGQAEKANAVEAIGGKAYDFLCKPIDPDELQIVLRRAFYVAQLEAEYRRMRHSIVPDGFEGMVGTSDGMQSVFKSVRRVATTDASVLILGESGTGKEVVARAIHRRSDRGARPFVAINCGAIPETLLESELFGHEKGAFTGAHIQRKGRIEAAAGGTLFLDEIGELSPLLQVKLLRFLQEHAIERVGGRSPIDVDTRILAATNVDLKKAMAGGAFREDLYYRLAVVTIELPPLRDRAEDMVALANLFLQRFSAESDRGSLAFNRAAVRALVSYPWPGNVRELENRVRRAVIMADGGKVKPEDLELEQAGSIEGRTLRSAREDAERQVIVAALKRHDWKITPSAAELEISRPTLYELIEKLGLTKS